MVLPEPGMDIRLSSDQPARLADAMELIERGYTEGKPYADLLLMPGDLLPLSLMDSRLVHPPNFWYVYNTQDKQPLVFGMDGPAVSLDGKPVFLDTTDPNAAKWMDSHKPGELAAIRGLRLSGDVDADLAVIKRLGRPGMLFECPKKISFAREETRRLAEAIVNSDPGALVLNDADGIDLCLPRLKNLTQLVIQDWPSGRPLPSLRDVPRLKVFSLGIDKPRKNEGPLASLPAARQPTVHADLAKLDLDKLPDLHSLFIECGAPGTVNDLRPLKNLHQLRHLSIINCVLHSNLASLPLLGDLTSLEVVSPGTERDFVGLEYLTRFTRLEKLSLFCEFPKKTNFRVLSKLASLKILVLPKDFVENPEGDITYLRKALPNCRIYGICVGSRWIIAILAAGIAAGVAWRRFVRGRGLKRLVTA